MPLPLLIPAAIAGAQLLGQGINALTGANANKQNREFAEQMYNQQHADQIQAWNDTNEYNSPQAQMKRLQEAGLNPNIVYGNGAAVQTASPQQTPDKATYTHRPAQVDLGSPVAGYFDAQMRQAQLDNLKAQNTNIMLDGMLKQKDLETRSFDLGFKTDVRDARVTSEKTRANILLSDESIRQVQNDIVAATADMSIEGAFNKVLQQKLGIEQSKVAIKKLNNDVNMQQLELNLKKNGINSSDPVYFRIIGQLLSKLGYTINP